MKRTRLLALLLAVAALLGLAGCGARSQQENAYEAPVTAFAALLNNADATWEDAVQAAVGDFCGDELTRLARLLIDTGALTDDGLTQLLLGKYREVYGYDCTFAFALQNAMPMDADTLARYREQIQADSAIFDGSLQELQRDGALDWEGGEPLDETREMEELYTALRDRFANAELSEGYVLTLTVTVSGGDLKKPEVSEDTMNVLCIDGVWVQGDVFDNTYTN